MEKMLSDGRIIPLSKLNRETAYAEGVIVSKIMTMVDGKLLCKQCYEEYNWHDSK